MLSIFNLCQDILTLNGLWECSRFLRAMKALQNDAKPGTMITLYNRLPHRLVMVNQLIINSKPISIPRGHFALLCISIVTT